MYSSMFVHRMYMTVLQLICKGKEERCSTLDPIIRVLCTNLQVNHKHVAWPFTSPRTNWVQEKRAIVQSLGLFLLIHRRLEEYNGHGDDQLHRLRLLQTTRISQFELLCCKPIMYLHSLEHHSKALIAFKGADYGKSLEGG